MPVTAWLRTTPAVLLAVLVTCLPHAVGGIGVAHAQSGTGDDLDRLRANRQALAADLDELTAELDSLAVRITDARAARRRLVDDVRALETEAAEAEDALRMRALATYVAGPGDPVHLLLSSSGPGQALARSRVLGGLGSRERRMIERAAAARTALGQRRGALDEVLASLRTDERRVAVLQDQVAAAFDGALVAETRLANLRARQRRVSRGGQQGLYACPIARPFHFRDTWGAPRSGGRRHRGVDIFAPAAADVYAITAGRIARHSSSRLGGIGLYLAGDDGNAYYYAHLREILPAYGPGRRVQAGELIARNGSTGNADTYAPHVHLEVRPGGGGTVNPYPFAAAACF
jgi:murein DD-endopeptidase MepM/ murein hydrolase activator NlpD